MGDRYPHTATGYLKWPRLLQGTLIRRYQRFLADVKLRNGHRVTAHCPNSGSMQGCCEPGRPVYISRHDGPKRRLKYTWEMIDMPASLVGVNTLTPNRLVKASIVAGKVPKLRGYANVRSEVKISDRSRIDLMLESEAGHCFVEIKNCSLVVGNTGYFPDAVTERGRKHLIELQEALKSGHRAVMFYLVQRMDAQRFSPADHIDPLYGAELRRAVAAGLEVLVYDTHISVDGIRLNRSLPCVL
jgi:sugar fermentation stimulation protein A